MKGIAESEAVFLALAAQHAKCSLHPAGMQSNDGFGSPTYPASQPGYLRHRPSAFQQSSHTTPAEAFFSKEVLDPPAKTGTVLPAQSLPSQTPHIHLQGSQALDVWLAKMPSRPGAS